MDPIVLADAGGWAVAVGTWLAIGLATMRGLWVPRFVYDRETRRADLNAGQLVANTEVTGQAVSAVEALEAEVHELRGEIRELRRSG